MMANLADAWTDFKQEIGDAGFFETMQSESEIDSRPDRSLG